MVRALLVTGLLVFAAGAALLGFRSVSAPERSGTAGRDPSTAPTLAIPVIEKGDDSPPLPDLLGRTGPEWAGLLRDEGTRAEALGLLLEAGEQAVPLLDALLRQNDSMLRWGAVELFGLLVERGDAAAVMTLAALVTRSGVADVRERALEALAQIMAEARKAALDALVTACGDPEGSVRMAAVLALEGVWNGSAIEALRRALRSDASVIVRAAAADALITVARSGDPWEARETVPVDPGTLLAEVLEHGEDPRRRALAASWMGHVGAGPEVAVPALVEALRTDPSSRVHVAAVRALRTFGPSGMQCLRDLVTGDEDCGFRGTVIEALGWMGPEAFDAAPVLVDALSGTHSETAATALVRIGRRDVVHTILGRLPGETDPVIRAGMMRVVGSLGGDDVVSVLAAELRSSPEAVIEALGMNRSVAAAAALAEELRRPGRPNARLVVEALRRFPREALGPAVPELVELARHDDGWVRWRTAQTLGRGGTNTPVVREALEALAAEDQPDHVRQAAEWALRQISNR